MAVLPVRVPPLRHRREDLEPLVRHFLGGETPSPELLDALARNALRGNVRELPAAAPETVCRIPFPIEGDFKEFRERWIAFGEREYLRRMMERHANKPAQVAIETGVNRTYVYRLIRKHGL